MRTPFLSGRAVLEDEQKFFEIVQTTPDLVEADSLIREALACVKEEKAISQESKNTIRLTQLGALSDNQPSASAIYERANVCWRKK